MTVTEYREKLTAGGFKVVDGYQHSLWVSHERFSMQRQPACTLYAPSEEEITTVFRRSHAAMLSFTVQPSEGQGANSCLYLCKDPEYSLEKLSKGTRYDTRRGLREFDIQFIDQSETLRLGKQALRDTLDRTGLSVDSGEKFEDSFRHRLTARQCLGAMRGNRLAGFLLITQVDDWVLIGGYSANEFLPLRPNNALVFYAVRHYLVKEKLRVVDYGLSSIQAVSKAEGLHSFKVRMGFEPISVRRVFVVNPMLRPLVNRVSWKLMSGILKLSPRHRVLKKAEGALRVALEQYDCIRANHRPTSHPISRDETH